MLGSILTALGIEVAKEASKEVVKKVGPAIGEEVTNIARKVWNFASYKCPRCGHSFTSTQSPGSIVPCSHCGFRIQV